MNNTAKRFMSLIMAASVAGTVFPAVVLAEESAVYTCDFTQLVTDGADTYYGTAEDVIELDEYTTAYLTYEGTYVDADGNIHFTGENNGKGKYERGSYVEFTAPSDGTFTFDGDYVNYYIDGSYKGYSPAAEELTAGQTVQVGQRVNDRGYLASLTFTPDEEEPEPEPPSGDDAYVSPSTTWDFPAEPSGAEGAPTLGGNAVWSDGEIVFPSDTTESGSLSVEFGESIRNNVSVEADITGHSKTLGGQYIRLEVRNSEETVAELHVHPYSDNNEDRFARGFTVCGTQAYTGDEIRAAWGGTDTVHVKLDIDYYAGEVSLTIGDSEPFTAKLPEGTVADVSAIEIEVTRDKTAGDRYISADNLTVSEFESTGEQAPAEVAEGYSEENIAGYPCRVKAQDGAPAVIYLSSESRCGSDNVSQLYDARYIFDILGDRATLVAPQTADGFTDVSQLAEEVRGMYNAPSVTVIGQSESVGAALSSGADRVVTIAGSGSGEPSGDVWVFAGCEDEITPVSDVKTMVNSLQLAGVDTRYTEYPFGTHKLAETAAEEEGLADWIINGAEDGRTVDLVLFAGQSNMAGRGDYDEATVCAAGKGYEYHAVTEPGVLSAVTEPFGKYENNDAINDNSGQGVDRRSGDMVSSVMSAYYDATGVPMVGVQASRGGQDTTYFMNNTGEMQSRFNEAAEYLESAGYTVRNKLLVWCQGESDADKGRTDEDYKSNTLSIFNSLKEGCGIEDMFIVRTGHYNIYYNGDTPSDEDLAKDAEYLRISEAQQALADEEENIYVAASLYSDEYLSEMRDQFHYYQSVYNSVGKAAGEAIAAVYSGEEPAVTEEPSDDDKPGVSYSWDFSEDQSGTGNNVPEISGSAQYNADNENVRLAWNGTSDQHGAVTVTLDPAAAGVVTAEFDMNLSSLSKQYINVSIADGAGAAAAELSLDTYHNLATVTIGGEEICTGEDVGKYMNKVSGDGMGAKATHFVLKADTARREASITMSAEDGESRTFSGSIPADVKAVGSLVIARECSNKSGDGRHCYVDNIEISSYEPGKAIYAAGDTSVTKKLGETVTAQYELSKTYTDDAEKPEWSVSGVEGVTIDKVTGLLSVPESAGTGTAKVTVTLTAGSTLPTGTSSSIDVEIKDFAKPAEYELGGTGTIELGKSTKFTIESLADEDGNDITEYASLTELSSSEPSVVSVSADGTAKAEKAGKAVIKGKLSVERLGWSTEVEIPVRAGVFELVTSDAEADITSLVSYGTNTYRVYTNDGNYTSVKAENGKVGNSTGGEVVIVPEYRFEFTDLTSSDDANISGYVKAGEGSYSAESGYGLTDADYRINKNGCYIADAPIKADLPEGFYDITLYRKGGARADIYNNGTLIANNTTSATAQNRSTGTAVMEIPAVKTDGGISLTFGNTSGSNERIASVSIAKVPDRLRKPVIWIAGDSESANYYAIDADGDDLESDKIMITGFGQQLSKLLSDKYSVSNYGQPSATVKTWYDECFESVNELMQPGDTILVDFGINDANSSNEIPIDEMKSYMQTVFDAAKAKGVTPVLISPVYSGKRQSSSYFTYNAASDTNEMYEFAESCGVEYIDLNKYTQLYVNKAAEETGDVNWRTNNYHVGDDLHLTQHSAVLAASFIAAGMKSLGYETSDFEYIYSDISAVEDGNIRGEETGIRRIYSAAAAEAFMKDGTVLVPGDATETPGADDIMSAEMTYDGTEVRMMTGDDSIKSAVLAAAEYDNGALASLEVYDVGFENGAASRNIAAEEGTVFYLWDSLSGMVPIAKSIEYTGAAAETAAPTAAPTATAAPATEPPATAVPEGRLIYSDDFEDHKDGETADWESYAGTAAVMTDSTPGIGKHMTVVSGKSGTCRSGLTVLPQAVTENFVFECDLKTGDGNNVSELQLVESKDAVYQNHGVYSNREYALTLDRPKGSSLYVINNGRSDSGLTLDLYNSPAVTTAEIPDEWLHVKAVGNFDTKTIIVDVTSLDGKTVYYRGMTDMSAGMDGWQCIHLLSPSTGVYTCIDNIKITEATEQDLGPVFHNVEIKCKSYSFSQYTEDGASVINIPDVSVYGSRFEGWQVNGGAVYSTEELSKLPITSDSVIEGIVSGDYIENLASIDFASYPAGEELVMGADENTYGDNIISLSITGEQGTSLVTEPDPRVTDYKIEWSFDGFRILDGRPTGEEGNVYCDSYGLCEITEQAQTSVNFRLKRTAANYYGQVRAKVTYNGKTLEISRPLVLLGDKAAASGRMLPAAGYASDYNKYDGALAGYTFEQPNSLFGNWTADGSDSRRYIFMTDDTGNFIRFERDASGNSAYGYNEIGSITSQTIFEQDVRFNADGSIRYTGGRPTSESSSAFSLTMSGGALSFNGERLCPAENGVWYHAVICADPTTKKAWAKVYEGEELIGESETVDFEDSDFSSAVYYRIDPAKVRGGSIDFNNVIIRRAEIADITVNAPETAAIPDSGSTAADISMSAVTTDGFEAIGKAEWSVDENADGVSIASSGDRTAVLTIDSSAAAGDVTVSVTIGGKTEQFTIRLTGTKDNISFTKAPAGVMIPAEGEAVYEFGAVVRNGSGEETGGDVEYSLDGSYDGISLDGGMLKVSSEAKPGEIVITASSGELSRSRRVSVYNLKFDLTAEPEDGYTAAVSAVYSDSLGYGKDNAVSDTEYTFKVKLEKGKVYSVNARYSGTIKCKRIEGFSDGFERSRDGMGDDSFNTAVFGDDIMDITVNGTLERIEIAPVKKSAAEVPDWWTIGDSTVQQNGSWAYTIASGETSELSEYPELDAVIDVFHNSGRAGRQHMSYYSEGLLNNVLCGMEPGDVVSISGMGVNDSSSTLSDFKRYTELYMNAIIDMGGYVILGSYTPSGNYGATEGKVYDADTMTFRGMRTDAYDRAIREVYEENKDNERVLGFLDIGAMADAKMTADVQAVYEAALGSGEAAARAAANARAAEMMGWWKDYNHYYTEFSDYILPDITKAAAELIASR